MNIPIFKIPPLNREGIIMTENNKNKRRIAGEGINTNYKRSPQQWMDILIDCLGDIQQQILELESFNNDDSEHIQRNVTHVKRFYEELEKQFFREHLTTPNAEKSKVESNITIHF